MLLQLNRQFLLSLWHHYATPSKMAGGQEAQKIFLAVKTLAKKVLVFSFTNHLNVSFKILYIFDISHNIFPLKQQYQKYSLSPLKFVQKLTSWKSILCNTIHFHTEKHAQGKKKQEANLRNLSPTQLQSFQILPIAAQHPTHTEVLQNRYYQTSMFSTYVITYKYVNSLT